MARIDPQHLQYFNNPIIILAKVKRQRSKPTKYAFALPYPLSLLLDLYTIGGRTSARRKGPTRTSLGY